MLVITQFASRESAQEFSRSGLAEMFRERVMTCSETPPDEPEGFDLFFATLADGSRVVFGEDG